MEKPEQEDLTDVLSAIRKMVRDETRAKFSDGSAHPEELEEVEPETEKQVPNVPSKVFMLQKQMQVNKSKPELLLLGKKAKVSPDTPTAIEDSFAVANPGIDENLIRDIVREVVQEQLRGELGKELIGTIKHDMLQLLEKNR